MSPFLLACLPCIDRGDFFSELGAVICVCFHNITVLMGRHLSLMLNVSHSLVSKAKLFQGSRRTCERQGLGEASNSLEISPRRSCGITSTPASSSLCWASWLWGWWLAPMRICRDVIPPHGPEATGPGGHRLKTEKAHFSSLYKLFQTI